MGARLSEVVLWMLRLPLTTPYRLSYRTFEKFEPFVVELRDDTGRTAFGEGHISPGSSGETREAGWSFARRLTEAIAGLSPAAAKESVEKEWTASPVAATALISALEMLQGHPLLEIDEAVRLPLLSPVNGLTREEIESEIEHKLEQGFSTFKIKVGTDVDSDLERVSTIQHAVDGRATLRVDANRGYGREDAIRFATRIDPEAVELFEQPCATEDWDANAAVADVSRVPLMLDEPICAGGDIERAASINGVGYVKLKLKRFGGLDRLHSALVKARSLGLKCVLGDGLGSEPVCWMEACVARSTIDNAGEFNGFLKPRDRLFKPPLEFDRGQVVMPAGFRPELDQNQLGKLAIKRVRWPSRS